MTKSKVLIILPGIFGGKDRTMGGSERMVVNLCNNLDRSKIDVVLCLLNAKENYENIIKPDVKTVVLDTRVYTSLFKIIKIIKSEKPDIIMSTLTHLNIYLSIFRFLISSKIKIVARESNVLSLFLSKKSFIQRIACRVFFKRFDKIIAQSKDMEEDLNKNFSVPNNKIVVINNFVDENFIERKLSERIEEDIFPNDRINLLSIGRLFYQKGYDILLHSFSKFEYKDDYYLTILGDGPEREPLETLILKLNLEGHVCLKGYVDNPYKYMACADVFISSSRFEGFPNVVIESLVCGLPVVSSFYIGGINEILSDSDFGQIINIEDVSELQNAINNVRHKDKGVIKQKALDRYSKDRLLKKYESVFLYN